MKKLIVLLLAFATVGMVFAQTPTLSASSTLSFGVDLDTGYTGFKNANSATLSVLFPFADASKKGDKGWWGEIAVKNLYFKISDAQLTTGSALTFADFNDKDGDGVADSGEYATLTAKITNGVWALSVSNKNSLDFANADALDDGDVALTVDADTAGTTLSYAANGLSFGVTAASKGDWTANTLNEYAFGTNVGYKVSDALNVSAALAYDALDADKELGATATVAYAAGALSASVVTDVVLTAGFSADVLLTTAYNVMEGLDVGLVGYYSMGDSDVEAEATVEFTAGAFGLSAYFDAFNVLTAAAYELGVTPSYTVKLGEKTSLYLEAEATYDFTTFALVPYAKLTDTSITNTTLTLTYNAGYKDVLANTYGTLVAAAKVSL